MKAHISYKMAHIPHPWNDVCRKQGGDAWCLIKVTVPEYGDHKHEPVAIFNLDSEAMMFQGEILIAGLEKLIEIPDAMKELFKRGLV